MYQYQIAIFHRLSVEIKKACQPLEFSTEGAESEGSRHAPAFGVRSGSSNLCVSLPSSPTAFGQVALLLPVSGAEH